MVFRLVIVLFFFSIGAFSQEKYIKHTISKGDNLTTIAKKYGVKPKDIAEANPNAPKILKLNSVLLIPNNNKKITTQKTETVANTTSVGISNSGIHEVAEKESLWAISKKYNISVDDLKKANPSLESEGLQIGQKLNIPSNAIVSTENTTKNQNIEKSEPILSTDVEVVVEVKPKETKYLIAKKYGITVAELERQNPFIKGKLPVGYILKIRTSKEKANQQIKDSSIATQTQVAEKTGPALENIETAKPEIVPVAADVEVVVEVQPSETKYAIAKRYGITVKELEKQNPFIKGKLPVGYVLKIRTSKEKADALENSKIVKETKKDTLAPSVQVAENSGVKKDSSTVFNVSNHSDLVNQLIVNATENIGVRYRSGGTTKAGFDCSGLMICTFNNFDIKLPRSSIEQSRIGIKVNSEEAQKGDLIFFKTNGRRHINHVGMVVEVLDGEIKFVHSSTHGGVMISSTREPYYERTFSQVNRVLQ